MNDLEIYNYRQALASIEKRAFFTQAVHGVNALLNTSRIGSTFMNLDGMKWLGKDMFFKTVNGVAKPKTHLFQNGLMGNKLSFSSMPGGKMLQRGTKMIADGYNALPQSTKNTIHKVDKAWNTVSGVQMGAMVADIGVDIASPKVPKMQKPIGPSSSMTGQTANNVSYGTKLGSAGPSLRKAEPIELPHLINILTGLKDEFMLIDKQSIDLMIKNLSQQDTYIMGASSMEMKGFINGGPRGLPIKAPGAYYIRFAWVDPNSRNQGIFKQLISGLLAQVKPPENHGVWMQINENNKACQKAVSSLGFKHIDTWQVGEKTSQIWLK
jgi:ribosomal protein S18 acetylase RimI-like enzyme